MGKLIAIDAGHGGVNRFGKYTTAPAKQFFHGNEYEFHDGGWFFEGVSNRRICDALCKILDKDGIKYVKVHHPTLDTPLSRRVEIANKAKASLYISNHSNASPTHTARGWEVFTGRGETRSDLAATILFEEMKSRFKDTITYRTDWRDHDPDKEENFFVLRATRMPAILVENFFFDNLLDAQFVHRKSVIEEIAEAQYSLIKRF